jgi:type I restriction enzyme S subunit
MMKGWKLITIGDLGKVVTGNTPPKKDPANYGGEYPFIKPTDMKVDRRYVDDWEENYSEKAYKRYYRSYIPPKATGVVTIGTVGEKLFQANRWCFTNQSVNVVIPNKDIFDPDFIFYVLKVNLPKVENANPGTASGRHHVSKSNFCSIKIWVPKSKETQRKIASILSAYDDLIENNLKRIKLLEEKAQLTYEEWFVRMKFPGHETTPIYQGTGLPEEWDKGMLKDIGEIITGKTPTTSKSEYYNGDIPFIKTPNLSGFPYVMHTAEYLTQTGADTQKKKYLPRNSLVVSCIGSAGEYALVAENSQFNQQINAIKFFKKENTFYVYCFAKYLKPLLDALGSNGATMTNVNKGKFEKIDIIKPEKELLKKIPQYC